MPNRVVECEISARLRRGDGVAVSPDEVGPLGEYFTLFVKSSG